MTNPFDALGINVTSSVRMPIVNPKTGDVIADKDGKEAYLELLSDDSEAGQRFDRALARQTMKKARANAFRQTDDGDSADMQADKVASLLTGWYLVSFDGAPVDLPFTAQNAKKLMAAQNMAWLRVRALAFVANAGNFMQGSSQSS